jgi:chorismate mutase
MLQVGLWYSPPVVVPVWALKHPHKEQPVMVCRGVRGATTVQSNTREEILRETRRLLALMIRLNGIESQDLASAIFTTTRDLNAEYPALAARQLGWLDAALMCGHEMEVPNGLPLCVRILVHWNTTKMPSEIQHVYLQNAVRLRPDKADLPPVDEEDLEGWIRQQLTAWHNQQGGTR